MQNEQLFVRLYFSAIDKWLFDPKYRYILHVYIYLCRQVKMYQITEQQGIKIFPWTVATTQKTIAEKLNISRQKVRHALKILEKDGFIKINSETARNHFTIIRIRVKAEQKTNNETAETLDISAFDEIEETTKNQQEPQKTNQKTNQKTDIETAETLAISALEAFHK